MRLCNYISNFFYQTLCVLVFRIFNTSHISEYSIRGTNDERQTNVFETIAILLNN